MPEQTRSIVKKPVVRNTPIVNVLVFIVQYRFEHLTVYAELSINVKSATADCK